MTDRRSSDRSTETHVALLESDVEALKAGQLDLHAQIAGLQAERDKALRWGIGTLGAMVLALVGFIGAYVKDHLK